MPRLAIHLFGVPHILRDGAPVHVEQCKALAALAYLALAPRAVARDELAALLWPDLDQQGARTMVPHALSTLQRAIGRRWFSAGTRLRCPAIPTSPSTQFVSAPCWRRRRRSRWARRRCG